MNQSSSVTEIDLRANVCSVKYSPVNEHELAVGSADHNVLLFDTRTLEALPRAMTTIGVGVLLLLAAVAYVVALSRLNAATGPVAAATAAPAAASAPAGPPAHPGTAGPTAPGTMWAAPPRE